MNTEEKDGLIEFIFLFIMIGGVCYIVAVLLGLIPKY